MIFHSPELSRRLFQEGDIISPVRRFWSDPVYDEPDPYFSGQARGRLYVSLAEEVPPRYNSAFSGLCLLRLQAATSRLAAYADRTGNATPESLLPEAQRILAQSQAEMMDRVRRNRFFAEDLAGTEAKVQQ